MDHTLKVICFAIFIIAVHLGTDYLAPILGDIVDSWLS